MDQKFDVLPKAEIKLDGRRVSRSHVSGDWGLRLQWEIRRDGQVIAKRKVEWGLPDRGRISPEEAAYVREHLDEVQELRSARGMPLIDPAAPRTKERYGL